MKLTELQKQVDTFVELYANCSVWPSYFSWPALQSAQRLFTFNYYWRGLQLSLEQDKKTVSDIIRSF